MSKKIVVLAGDGVGPEVTGEAVRVLKAVSTNHELGLEFEDALIGGAAYDAAGSPLPEATVAACKASSGILLGAVGGPKWADIPVQHRPEQGLLAIRKALGLFANLRPVTTVPELAAASPLKAEKLKGVDILVIRELTGGIYFGKRGRTAQSAFDTCEYTTAEIERVCRVAGKLAMARRRKVTSVDKANVLDTSRLWRDVATRVFRDEFPQLTVEHLLVDAAAMHLLSRPADFDVMVTENMFGDILTDEASMLAGSMGLAALRIAWRQRPRPLRTHPWLGTGYRGPGRGESLWHDTKCCDAAAVQLRRRGRGSRHRGGRGRRAQVRRQDARHRGPGRGRLARNQRLLPTSF